MTFPVEKVRADFPILQREVNGLPLAYGQRSQRSKTQSGD